MSKKKVRAPKRIKQTSTDRKRAAKKEKIAKLRAKKDLKLKKKAVENESEVEPMDDELDTESE